VPFLQAGYFFRYLTDKSKRRKINEIVTKEESRVETLQETARKMKDMGLSAEQIKEVTGISVQG